jgi:hypothetical protein
MSKQRFYDYLDDPSKLPDDPESAELANLLKEVSDLETPDPGQAYWNQFNSRLQQKLDGRKARRRRGILPAWALGIASLAAAVLLAVWFIPGPTSLENDQSAETTSLEALDDDALLLLGQVYETSFDSADYQLDEANINLLVDTFTAPTEAGWFEEDFTSFDAEAFIALWETEG